MTKYEFIEVVRAAWTSDEYLARYASLTEVASEVQTGLPSDGRGDCSTVG